MPRVHGPRSTMIATIDGVAAPESPLARVFVEHGFVPRQGSLVLIPMTSTSKGRSRPWAAREEDIGVAFEFPNASSEIEVDDIEELEQDA